MTLTLEAQPVPLVMDRGGVLRVAGTRVTLESLVYAFKEGATSEQIVQSYDSLSLGDVYSVIAFYLRHMGEIDAYLREYQQESDSLRDKFLAKPGMKKIRERLLDRKRQLP